MKILENPKAMEMVTKMMTQVKENPEMMNDLLAGRKPTIKRVKKPPRNSKCPCGSDKKYKNCCLVRSVESDNKVQSKQ